MAENAVWEPALLQIDDDRDAELPALVLPHRRLKDGAELDMTPMIDVTFLLLIFFIVCSTASTQREVELPPAQYGMGVDPSTSTIITMTAVDDGPVKVYLGDGTVTGELPDDPLAQEAEVSQAVEEAVNQGRTNVLIKAARNVHHRDVSRIAAASGRAGEITLHLGVVEVAEE
ncbi:MAG: biopolymer transporter ExbD [Thermoguttaceae bacterium]|nr:biopolymer transporter ExbD [Thermoguttaceae bacterium]